MSNERVTLDEDEPPDVDFLPAQNFRRLACALLLRAVQDAREGDADANAWINGEEAARWAELLGLALWPPSDEQIAAASTRQLQRTARYEGNDYESVGTLSIRAWRRRAVAAP